MPKGPSCTIGRYEILAELGRGAMGVVYEARDPQLDRLVVLKTGRHDLELTPEEREGYRRRFGQEAAAAARLNHPNIVGVYDLLEVDGASYLVMEYVEGKTLARLLAAEGPLAPERAVPLAIQVCHALGYAHARGVIHRDIKPSNILVAGGRTVKVTDFGIARIAGTKLTQTGAVLGSPSYMSPEQIAAAALDGRSDLFSLGVVLYEALTGADPFAGDSPSAVLYKVLFEEPRPLLGRDPAIPPRLEAAVRRALAKDPASRYRDAEAFADALSAALAASPGGAAAWSPAVDETLVLARPRAGRRIRAVGMAVAFIVVAAVGAFAVRHRPLPSPPSPGLMARGAPGQAADRGSVRVFTNPAVEVFVDGRSLGRVERPPLLIEGVPAGKRTIVLRLGSAEQRFQGRVRPDRPFSLTYYFSSPSAATFSPPPPVQAGDPVSLQAPGGTANRPAPPEPSRTLLRPPDPS